MKIRRFLSITWFGIFLASYGVLSLDNDIEEEWNPPRPVQLRKCCESSSASGSEKCVDDQRRPTKNNVTQSHLHGNNSVEIPKNIMSTNLTTKFEIVSKSLKCSGGLESTRNFPLTTTTSGDGNTIVIHPSGYILLTQTEHRGGYFHKSQYCISRLTTANIEIRTCKPTCGRNEPCISKCCPLDSIYTKYDIHKKGNCANAEHVKWKPRFFESRDKEISRDERRRIQPWYSLNQPPAWLDGCAEKLMHILFFDKSVGKIFGYHGSMRHRFQQDGSLKIWNSAARRWKPYDLSTNRYCVDGIQRSPDIPFNNSEEDTFMVTCAGSFEEEEETYKSVIYGVFLLMSSLFALGTVVAYGLLWDKQNVHGWTLMSLTTSMFLYFVFVGTAYITKHHLDVRATIPCQFIATMSHFFQLSTFCWLTTISFDLWLTFRSLTLHKDDGILRFWGYSLFAWGLSLLIVGLSWTMEMAYKNDDTSEVIVPMYGVFMCYLTTFALWHYVFAPCTVLISLDILLFVRTTLNLYKLTNLKITRHGGPAKDTQTFLLFLKLFIVVGVLWSLEIIGWAVGTDVWYWHILDSLNVLSPVAIFVIFVLKPDVLKDLSSKHPGLGAFCCSCLWIVRILFKNEVNETHQIENANETTTEMQQRTDRLKTTHATVNSNLAST